MTTTGGSASASEAAESSPARDVEMTGATEAEEVKRGTTSVSGTPTRALNSRAASQ